MGLFVRFRSKLSRAPKHRRAMLRNMVTSLIKYERIETTYARARVVAQFANKIVALGKEGSLWSRRRVASFVFEKEPVQRVFRELAERYRHRPGGFTRVVRTRWRRGDGAPMAYVEFVDREGELRAAKPALPLDQYLERYFPATLEAARAEKLKTAPPAAGAGIAAASQPAAASTAAA